MRIKKWFAAIVWLCLLMSVFFGCERNSETVSKMDEAENLMMAHPDSAMHVLSSIDTLTLKGDANKARYALLMSMALDKNFIDTTNFDVLQPAIDYYPRKGNPDEKLRTYYYQARIYQNAFDLDRAMDAFLKGKDVKGFSDSLTYANLLVAEATLIYRTYHMEGYTRNSILAAQIYEKIGKPDFAEWSLVRALDGSVICKNKERSDSVINKIDSLFKIVVDPESKEKFELVKMTYAANFETPDAIREMLDTIKYDSNMEVGKKLNIVLGSLKINDIPKAKEIINSIDTCEIAKDPYKYLSLKHKLLAAEGKYEEAYEALQTYFDEVENENPDIYYAKTDVAKREYEAELENLNNMRKKDRLLWISLFVVMVLISVSGIIYSRMRIIRMKKILAEKERRQLQLENENLRQNNSVLALEKHNAQLECERRDLEAENMNMRIAQLVAESENLKLLLSEGGLPSSVVKTLQERVEMLNALLASQISADAAYSKPYTKWVKKLIADKDKFMESTRIAFRASHPKFIKYLEEHELTESEMNYVCLYALGLRGKDVGEYIQLKRHYHISSDIRKKLGMTEEDTNLGNHIRKLMKEL